MKKWSLFGVVFLVLCMAGCADEQADHVKNNGPVNSEIASNSDSVQISDSTALPSDKKIYEKLDDNLSVEAEFQMPEEELFTWSSKLKQFETRDEAAEETETLLSKLDIGCELGEPYIIALNSGDLRKVQKEIMNDTDYKDVLNAKNLGNNDFENDIELYHLEYSFVIDRMPVFGYDDPTVQYTGDRPLLAQNMRAVVTLSKSGIQ